MGNAFCHVELGTDDVAKAKKFYKGIFEWSLVDMKVGDDTYTGIGVGQGVGGGMAVKQGSAPSAWLPYVAVRDVKKTIAKAKKGGATIVVEYMEIPNMGALGIFTDPFGATLGVWEVSASQSASSSSVSSSSSSDSDAAEKKAKKEKKAAKKAEKAAKAAKAKKAEKAAKAVEAKKPKAAKAPKAAKSPKAKKALKAKKAPKAGKVKKPKS